MRSGSSMQSNQTTWEKQQKCTCLSLISKISVCQLFIFVSYVITRLNNTVRRYRSEIYHAAWGLNSSIAPSLYKKLLSGRFSSAESTPPEWSCASFIDAPGSAHRLCILFLPVVFQNPSDTANTADHTHTHTRQLHFAQRPQKKPHNQSSSAGVLHCSSHHHTQTLTRGLVCCSVLFWSVRRCFINEVCRLLHELPKPVVFTRRCSPPPDEHNTKMRRLQNVFLLSCELAGKY